MTIEYFIGKSIKVHGNKYIYSKVDLEHRDEKGRVCIICPIHGEFWQTPSNHLYGQGCPKCRYVKISIEKSDTLEDFLQKAKNVHGHKYDYSKVEYIDSKTKVCIICPKHGEFYQRPNKHLRGQGCKKCSWEKLSQERSKTSAKFIEEAVKIHGTYYDYSKVIYTNAKNKVKLICPKHGEFKQTPDDHLRGKGCPICANSKLEEEIRVLLEKNNIEYKFDDRTFEWLGGLELDFYLPKYNIAIECQGGQHFKAVKWFGGVDDFNKVKERDERKRKLCKENGIKLLYYSNLGIEYPYEVFEDKEKLLEEIKKYGIS